MRGRGAALGDRRRSIVVAIMAGVGATAPSPAAAQQPVALPTVEVVGNAPLPGAEIDRSKIPANVQTLDPSDFDHAKTPSLTDAMVRGLPGVSRGDQTGNPFQP